MWPNKIALVDMKITVMTIATDTVMLLFVGVATVFWVCIQVA